MDRGARVKLRVVDLAYGGEGVARPENQPVVFLPQALPGELVEAKITASKKNYSRAEVLDIIETSSARVTPDCPVYDNCGGCQLQHLDYKEQLAAKKKMITDSLERIAGLEFDAIGSQFQVQGMEFPWYYRNKGQFPLSYIDDELKAGFYQAGSHKLIPFAECKIQDQPINRLLQKTVSKVREQQIEPYQEKEHSGTLRHLLLRSARCSGQLQLTFITRLEQRAPWQQLAQELKEENRALKGVYQNINPRQTNVILGARSRLLAGQPAIEEYLGEKMFLIYPSSFFQINSLMAERLYRATRQLAEKFNPRTIIDAYCGSGVIALYLADLSSEVYGIDSNKASIEAAQANAKLNQLEGRTKFITAKTEEVLPELVDSNSLLIVDPPRKGLSSEIRKDILTIAPAGLLYVSCNPTTLARDLEDLKEKYKITALMAFDMFPQTYHVETLVRLELR